MRETIRRLELFCVRIRANRWLGSHCQRMKHKLLQELRREYRALEDEKITETEDTKSEQFNK